VVDGAVKRLLGLGIKIEDIQDSYDISFKDRVKFQADVQQYVDMAISSTCNLPMWGSEKNSEDTLEENAAILLKYARRLRGFTAYPDGCRDGQPLVRVDLQEALSNEGVLFEDKQVECTNGVCGI
jgi:ribonucleoside-diphosphate reductase alpha chain